MYFSSLRRAAFSGLRFVELALTQLLSGFTLESFLLIVMQFKINFILSTFRLGKQEVHLLKSHQPPVLNKAREALEANYKLFYYCSAGRRRKYEMVRVALTPLINLSFSFI